MQIQISSKVLWDATSAMVMSVLLDLRLFLVIVLEFAGEDEPRFGVAVVWPLEWPFGSPFVRSGLARGLPCGSVDMVLGII